MPTSQRTLQVMAILLAAAEASAQTTTGAIQGSVTEAGSGQPFPAVLVTASSAALQQPQTEISDASGQFYLSNLPPGTYVVLFVAGDAQVRRENVEVALGKVAVVNAAVPFGAETVVI